MRSKNTSVSISSLIGFLVLCLFCTVSTAQVAGEEIEVSTELSRSSVYVGDELSYQIIVKGSNNPLTPEIEFPDLVRSQFHGRTSQSFTSQRIVNGVRRSVTERSYIFQYTLTAMGEGRIEIPAPTVMVDGTQHIGNTATFQALLPSVSDDDDMEILIDRTDIYLNETVEAECVWWIADQTSEFNFSATSFPESFVLRPVPHSGGGQYQVDFILNGQSMNGTVETQIHDGKQMSRFSFRISITPSELGEYELGPLRAIFTRHSGTGSRFRAYAESDSISIRVLPVPQDGRPDNYQDAIGEFQLVSRASNTRVNVGDPIQLTLRIRGLEPMLGANTPPDLNNDPEFSTRFKIDTGGWREITPRTSGTRLFETTVRATDDQVNQIPSIKLPSFNPALGAYKVYQSEPIPLDVTAVREVTLADAIVRQHEGGPSSRPRPTVDRVELTTASPGLWAHGSANEMMGEDSFQLAQTTESTVWQAVLITPPLLYLASLAFVGYQRSRDESLLRLRSSYSSAKRHHGINALRTYLAGVLNIEISAVSAIDAYELPINDELRQQCYQLLITDAHCTSPHEQDDCGQLLRRIHNQCVTNYRKGAA